MKKTSISIFEMVTLVALLFAPLSLLFVDNNLLFPYITSKNFAWRYAIDIALFGWAALALLDPRYRINIKNPIFITFSFFVCIMGLANMLGVDPYRAFWSNAERMDGYVGLLHIYGFFVVLLGFVKAQVQETQLYNYVLIGLFTITIGSMYSSVIANTMSVGGGSSIGWFTFSVVLMGVAFVGSFHRPNFMKTMLHGLLAIGVLLGVMAILQTKVRADAILGNPIYLASYASFAFFISLYFAVAHDYLLDRKYVRPLLYGALALFFVLVIFETATRGAILGLLFGGFTTALLLACTANKGEEKIFKRIGIVITTCVVLLVGTFFTFKNTLSESNLAQSVPLIERAANFSLEDKTTKHRISNWGMALEGVHERPLFGWGQESYIHVFSRYYRANELHDAEQWFDRTHNMFLDWLLFGGVFGLVAFLGLLGTGLYMIWSKGGKSLSNVHKAILSGVIIAYMAQNFVAFDSLATGLWIALVLAWIALLQDWNKISEQTIEVKDSIATLSIVSMVVILCIWLSVSYYQPRAAINSFMSTLRSAPVDQSVADASLERYNNLVTGYNKGTFFTQEIIEQLLSRPQIYTREGIPRETQSLYFTFISDKTEKYLEENPHITRVSFFYGTLLHNLKLYDRAQVHLARALEQSPEKINILLTLGKNYIDKGERETGLRYIEQAASLAPDSQRTIEVYEFYKSQDI